MKASSDAQLQIRMEYHNALVSRRWQYLATYVLFTGFLVSSPPEGLSVFTEYQIALAVASIVAGMAFLRMTSRSRGRIIHNAAKVNELSDQPILSVPDAGSWGLNGITIWLYVAHTSLSALWFVVLYLSAKTLFFPFLAIFLINLLTLRWRYPATG